jgi:predicted membrane channel-forming protein YqfA (hemolysin III family)
MGLGYRVESYRTYGTAALVVLTPLFFIYLFALIKFNAEELPRGLFVFFLCTLIVLLSFAVIFITVKGEEKVRPVRRRVAMADESLYFSFSM